MRSAHPLPEAAGATGRFLDRRALLSSAPMRHAGIAGRSITIALLLTGAACLTGGCNDAQSPTAALTQLTEARRLTGSLRLLVNKSADAEKRAVMAETDEASKASADEASAVSRMALEQVVALRPMLEKLQFLPEQRLLSEFEDAFEQSRTLDATILELAVENTNLKAQRLCFGSAAAAAAAVRRALDGAVASAPAGASEHAQLLAARIELAIDKMRLLEGPHIAEPDDAVMTALETHMSAYEEEVRRLLASLESAGAATSPESAGAAFERFVAVHKEILALSRRNTNVRSLALSLGQKRNLTAACDEILAALQAALESRGFRATR